MTHRRQRHSVLTGLLGAALGLLLAAPALAGGETTSGTVVGGALTISQPLAGGFASQNITALEQTTTAGLDPFVVADRTGSGAGWHVTVHATRFQGGTRELAAGSLQMSRPTVSALDTASPLPDVNAAPVVIDGATAATIASATPDAGIGAYEFGATTLTLSLPPDVHAGAYTSTVTISIIAGP